MAQVYFDSGNTADGSRDGTQGHPFLDPSELPTAYRMVSGTDYLFKRGTTTNFASAFRLSATAAGAISIGAWGTGADPIITAYRELDSSECVECDVDNSGATAVLTIPPAGGAGSTNLWRVPKTFFGLFADEVWGAATDVVNAAGDGAVLPAAEREWCGAVADQNGVTGGYGVIYSVGNPVTTYGGVYVSSFDEGDWATEAEQATFATLRAVGGFEISGLDMRMMYRATMAHAGTTSTAYDLALHSYHDLTLTSIYRGINLNIGEAYAPNVKHASVRVYDNYAENMGVGFIDTSGTIYSCLNDTRIYRNVLNGFSRAMAWGGFYMAGGVYTTDGSRILVEYNTACNGDADHFWTTDGYAFYQEREGRNVEFRRNFAWNCKRNYIALWGRGDNVFSNNVAIADTGDYAPAEASSQFITINSGGGENHPDHRVRCTGNVSVGFRSFAKIVSAATDSAYEIDANISLRGGTTRAGVLSDLIDTARLAVDGNNFYDHSADLALSDSPFTTYNAPPEVTNRITSDPSAELARLPTPTDPTVNYALQIRPGARIVSGVVDLRPGTRLVAA